MRAVVTGAAGYIGSGLAYLLRLNGWEVEAIDIRPGWYSREVSVADYVPQRRPDVVFHLAAASNIELVEENPRVVEWNVDDCWLIRDWNPNRIVFTSSSAVYASHVLPRVETDALGPSSEYGKGKLRCEQAMRPIDVILRLFNVIGDGNGSKDDDRNGHLIPALRSKRVMLHGFDRQSSYPPVRTWCDVMAVHSALLAAGTSLHPGVYNVGGTILSVTEIIALWERAHGRIETVPGPARSGDVRLILGDDAKLRATGWNRGRPIDQVIGAM